jgi:hypothetical protein
MPHTSGTGLDILNCIELVSRLDSGLERDGSARLMRGVRSFGGGDDSRLDSAATAEN